MSEAKLTDIHFLAVSVFCKHTHYIPVPPSTHCQKRNGKCLPLSDNRQSKRYFHHR